MGCSFSSKRSFRGDARSSRLVTRCSRSGLSVLREIGRTDPDLPELSVVSGSGCLNLNPTIVSLAILPLDSGVRVSVRAIAKEGLLKQDSARKAVEKVKELLQRRYA